MTILNEAKAPEVLDDSNEHRAQAIEYKKLAGLFNKNNRVGIIEMAACLLPLYFLSTSHAPYTRPLGCLFALMAVFLMSRDYTRSKNLDTKVVQQVLKGIDLEAKKPSFDRFFHNVLKEFSVVRIVVSRTLSTVISIYFLSSSMSKIFFGEDQVFGKHRILQGIVGLAIGIIACILYYGPYEKFDELKSKQ